MHGLKDLKLWGPGLQAVIFKLWRLRNHLEGLGRHRSLGPRPRDSISAMMLLAEEAHSEDQPCRPEQGNDEKRFQSTPAQTPLPVLRLPSVSV